MPAARLTPDELARVAKNRCACGCGESIRTIDDQRYFSQACRQRAYIARKADGRVLSSDDRRRLKAAELAKAERFAAAALMSRIAELSAERDRHMRNAARLDLEAAGQQAIPFPKGAK